jgi:hypothetical protein
LFGKAQELLGDASGAVDRVGVMAYAIRHVDGGSGAPRRDRGGASPRGFQVGSGGGACEVAGTCMLTGWNERCRLEQDLLNLYKVGHQTFPLLPPSTSRQRCYCSTQVDQGDMRALNMSR